MKPRLVTRFAQTGSAEHALMLGGVDLMEKSLEWRLAALGGRVVATRDETLATMEAMGGTRFG